MACFITWPLPLRLRTHLLGPVTGDTGVYVWNLWIFQHELIEHGHLPFSTDHVFSYTDGVDFSLHNYTALVDAIGAPLVSLLGLVTTFNLLLLAVVAMSALAVYGLCRGMGLGRWSAWSAGALFVASPVMVARQTAHASLVAAGALPLFLLTLDRALERGRRRDAALVGMTVALAAYSDAYYGVYCALMGCLVLAWRFLRIEVLGASPRNTWIPRALSAATVTIAAVVGWRLLTGGDGLIVAGTRLTMRTLYTPMLALMAVGGLRLWMVWRPRVRMTDRESIRRLWPAGLVACATCLVLLSPILVGVTLRFVNDTLPRTVTYWRSSPRGVDLLAYFVPNPNHPILSQWTHDALLPPAADAFPEFVAAFSWIGFVVIGVAAFKQRLPGFWIAFTVFFAALSLGPFVHIAGQNTFVVGPWAFLRYLPVAEMARSPARFAIPTTLGLSVLVACALEAVVRQRRRARVTAVLLGVGLAIELLPAPRALFSAQVPDVYRLIATSPDTPARVLHLPTGIRDGTSSIGNFSAAYLYYQTEHGHPMIGGYLSRVSDWRKRESERLPMLRALNALSEPGAVPPDEWLVSARLARNNFLARACVGFVIVDKRQASNALRTFANDALRLVLVHEDDHYQLSVPRDRPECTAAPVVPRAE